MVETSVLAKPSESVLTMMKGHHNVEKRGAEITASGIMEVLDGQPFDVLLANYSDIWTEVTKSMLIVIGDGTPQCAVHVIFDENVSTPGNLEQSRERRNEQMEILIQSTQ